MRRALIRYRTSADAAAENRRLITDVFRELTRRSPDGLRYAVLTGSDGSFFHLVETEGGASPLLELDAFKAFQLGIRERCVEPPVSAEVTVVRNYRMLAE
jgi:hypothetical protein